MRSKAFAMWIFCFGSSLGLIAQDNVNYTYSGFIKSIKQNNPISQRATNIASIGQAQYKAAKGLFDPMLNSSYTNKTFNGTNYFEIIGGEVKQPLFTSQYLKAGYEFAQGVYVNPEEKTSSYGLPYLGVEMSLLQGLVIDKRRAQVMKAKNYEKYYNEERLIQLNGLIYSSASAYFEWLEMKAEYTIDTYFLNLAYQRYIGTEALANIGEKPAVDTVEAAIFYQTRLLDQQASLIEVNRKFFDLYSYSWGQNGLPADTSSISLIGDSLESCYQKAKIAIYREMVEDSLNNPILTQYKSKEKILKVEKKLAREMIKPKLDVSYNFLSNNTTNYALNLSTNNYKWAANLSFPLFFRTARNEFKIADLNLKNNNLDFNNKSNEINLKLAMYKKTIGILAKQLENAEKSARYNKLLVEAEKLKFDNGESSLFLLNSRESKWMESELKLIDYKLKFIKNLLGLIYLNGNLNYDF